MTPLTNNNTLVLCILFACCQTGICFYFLKLKTHWSKMNTLGFPANNSFLCWFFSVAAYSHINAMLLEGLGILPYPDSHVYQRLSLLEWTLPQETQRQHTVIILRQDWLRFPRPVAKKTETNQFCYLSEQSPSGYIVFSFRRKKSFRYIFLFWVRKALVPFALIQVALCALFLNHHN